MQLPVGLTPFDKLKAFPDLNAFGREPVERLAAVPSRLSCHFRDASVAHKPPRAARHDNNRLRVAGFPLCIVAADGVACRYGRLGLEALSMAAATFHPPGTRLLPWPIATI
jgi:hypothetical protein